MTVTILNYDNEILNKLKKILKLAKKNYRYIFFSNISISHNLNII
jgi:hypothetical protein